MSRVKRTSSVLAAARQRLAGLKSIDPAPDFGDGLTLAAYEAEIDAFSDLLDSYHQELSALDETQNRVEFAEAKLRDKSRRMLRAVEGKYGSDSSEFEQAGGKRLSEHKPRRRKVRLGTEGGSTPKPATAPIT